ncbi:MAG: hypothetical protein JO151_03130 [Verrucomicrobia bacterium]|nr:hypothetical protein [Verrucomicrobiota bacterium]
MTTSIRTAVLGVLAGAAASTPLALCLGHPRASVAFGLAIGIAYAASTRRTPQAYVDNSMAGGALGVPLWGLISVVALPVLSRQRLEWSGEEMRAHFPALVVWIHYGALLGLFTKALSDLAEHVFGPETVVRPMLCCSRQCWRDQDRDTGQAKFCVRHRTIGL